MKVYKSLPGCSKFKELFTNKHLRKTLIVAFLLCLVTIIIIGCVQNYGQNKAGKGCSYLDPPIIDYLAFFAAIFLIIEGFWRILEHSNTTVIRQATRIFRIMLGCAIVTIHVLQFIHK